MNSAIEPLEPRISPAGILSVSVSAGNLVIKSLSGVAGDESIAITQTHPGELILTPSDGTQLQLGSVLLPPDQGQTIEAVSGGITIALGDGSDTVVLDGLQIAKNVSVDLGSGTNEITFQGDGRYGAVTIKAGAGNDEVSILGNHHTVAKSLNVRLGDGANDILFALIGNLSIGRDLVISMGKGNDEFDINTGQIAIGGKLNSNTGPGSDTTTIDAGDSLSVASDVRLSAMGGPTSTVIQTIRGGSLSMGNVKFSIGPSDTSQQQVQSMGEGLLIHGSVTMTSTGDADGSHDLTIQGGDIESSAVLGSVKTKGHSDVRFLQLGLIGGSLSVNSGAFLELILLRGDVSLDRAFRIAGKITMDTTKAKDIGGQGSIDLLLIAPDGPLVIRDGNEAVRVQVFDSRFVAPVTITMGGGADDIDIETVAMNETSIFFAPVVIRGDAGADTIRLGGANANDILSFRNKVTVDGGADIDVLTIGAQTTFAAGFPLMQTRIP